MYQKGKFVGKKTIAVDESVVDVIVKNFEAQGFVREYPSFLEKNLYFSKKVDPVLISGKHNSWRTNHWDRYFKAKPKCISITVYSQKGYMDGCDPYNWDTQLYSGYVTLRGGLAYKYSKNQKELLNGNDEIRNYFHYDNNIMEMLSEMNASIAEIDEQLIKDRISK